MVLFGRKSKRSEEDHQKLIFEQYYHRVYKTAYYIVKDEFLAQDLTHDTFIKAFQNMDDLQDDSKVGAWLGTIATRTAIDYIRRQKNRNDIPTENVYIDIELSKNQNGPSVEEAVERNLLKETIMKNIYELKPDYKEVIILKYVYELRDDEIAKQLGISVGAVKSRLHRARKRLQTVLTDHDDIGMVISNERK